MFIGCLLGVCCAYTSPKGFEVYLLNSTETMAWGRNKGFFAELCNGVLQGKELFTDPERPSSHNQTLSNITQHCDLFHLRLLPTCGTLSANDHHLTRMHTRTSHVILALPHGGVHSQYERYTLVQAVKLVAWEIQGIVSLVALFS